MEIEEKRNLKNKIIEHICDAILNDEYKQNDQIKEIHLANKLEVSRSPIREALLELVSLGILEQKERRGVFVKEVKGADILNTYQAQGVIEGFLATSFAEFATKEDMDKLDSLLLKMCEESNDSKAIAKYGKEFHNHSLKYATNTILLENLKKLNKRSLLLFSRNVKYLYNNLNEIQAEHKKIVEALKSRDKAKIETIIKKHYFKAGTRIVLLHTQKDQ